MLYKEIMAVCSQLHTKHINTLCGQNAELLNVKLAVHIVTPGLFVPAWLSALPVQREGEKVPTCDELHHSLEVR
jgi:hypothetical protein